MNIGMESKLHLLDLANGKRALRYRKFGPASCQLQNGVPRHAGQNGAIKRRRNELSANPPHPQLNARKLLAPNESSHTGVDDILICSLLFCKPMDPVRWTART